MPKTYSVIVADPPWQHGDQLPGPSRGASKNYRTMTTVDICALASANAVGDIPDQIHLSGGVYPIAEDALLFLWRVSSMTEDAYQVCRAWGFVPKAEIVWRKLTNNGKRWFGMGHYVRNEHETCIIARRGKTKVKDRSVRSTFEAPAGRHSEKPEAFFEIVEKLSDGPYLELFARRQRPGWTCVGDEVKYVAKEMSY